MAVSPEFLDDYIAEHGPWAFHFCESAGGRVRVLAEGLRPPGLYDSRSAAIDEALRGRPGHVYLCLGVGVALVVDQSFGWYPEDLRAMGGLAAQAVAVDLRGLAAASISPDEDCCYESTLTLGLGGGEELPMPGTVPPEFTVRDACSVEAEYESAEVFAARPYGSYGEWAEAQRIGSDVEHAQQCFSTFGSFAYQGRVPASLLRPATLADLLELELGATALSR